MIARRIRRIEREFGQEAFAGRITAGDLFEPDQIGSPLLCVKCLKIYECFPSGMFIRVMLR